MYGVFTQGCLELEGIQSNWERNAVAVPTVDDKPHINIVELFWIVKHSIMHNKKPHSHFKVQQLKGTCK